MVKLEYRMKTIGIRKAVDQDVIRITQQFCDSIKIINIRNSPQEEADDWSS